MTIAQRMFDEMAQKGVKPADLARYLGINKTVVSSWKKRDKAPPSEYIVRICVLLNISTSYLLSGSEEFTGLSEVEVQIINMYRILPQEDRRNCYDIMKMMTDRVEKKTTSLNCGQGSGETA